MKKQSEQIYTITPSHTGGFDIRISNEEIWPEPIRGSIIGNCPTIKMAEEEVERIKFKTMIKDRVAFVKSNGVKEELSF